MIGNGQDVVKLGAAAQKQELLERERAIRKVQETQALLTAWNGYLGLCNTFIAVAKDRLKLDLAADDPSRLRLEARIKQAESDVAEARDNISRILDDALDNKPPTYNPTLVVV